MGSGAEEDGEWEEHDGSDDDQVGRGGAAGLGVVGPCVPYHAVLCLTEGGGGKGGGAAKQRRGGWGLACMHGT